MENLFWGETLLVFGKSTDLSDAVSEPVGSGLPVKALPGVI